MNLMLLRRGAVHRGHICNHHHISDRHDDTGPYLWSMTSDRPFGPSSAIGDPSTSVDLWTLTDAGPLSAIGPSCCLSFGRSGPCLRFLFPCHSDWMHASAAYPACCQGKLQDQTPPFSRILESRSPESPFLFFKYQKRISCQLRRESNYS